VSRQLTAFSLCNWTAHKHVVTPEFTYKGKIALSLSPTLACLSRKQSFAKAAAASLSIPMAPANNENQYPK